MKKSRNGVTRRQETEEKLIKAGHAYLEGLRTDRRTILALSGYSVFCKPGDDRANDEAKIVAAMNSGLVGHFPNDTRIQLLIGKYLGRRPKVKVPQDEVLWEEVYYYFRSFK